LCLSDPAKSKTPFEAEDVQPTAPVTVETPLESLQDREQDHAYRRSRLAELMIEFGVAVATDATYTVKRIDNDFFEAI
jgi:hypothetical protein